MPGQLFEDAIEEIKEEREVEADTELTADDLEELVGRFKEIVSLEAGAEVPEDPYRQLELAIGAVFDSWLGERASGFEGRVSRRSLLSKAGVAAAGLVVAGALTQRDIREAKATPTEFSTNTHNRGAVEATNNATSGYGVWGKTPNSGPHGIGLYGTSRDGTGVNGEGWRGVFGLTSHNAGYGVLGKNTRDAGSGDGIGVRGESRAGIGVSGKSFGEQMAIDRVGVGVYGEGDYGVKGESFTDSAAAVWGLHRRNGSGVLGKSTGGIGVKGTSSADSLGAVEGQQWLGYRGGGRRARRHAGLLPH